MESFEIGHLLEHTQEALGFRVARILLSIGPPAAVILIEIAACPGPDRLDHALKMSYHERRRIFPKTRHVLYLCGCRFRVFPRTTHHIQAFHGEVNSRLIRSRVMPVADDHVPW